MLITKKGIKILATKSKLKAEQGKIENLQTHNLSDFLGKTFFLWWRFSKYVSWSTII